MINLDVVFLIIYTAIFEKVYVNVDISENVSKLIEINDVYMFNDKSKSHESAGRQFTGQFYIN